MTVRIVLRNDWDSGHAGVTNRKYAGIPIIPPKAISAVCYFIKSLTVLNEKVVRIVY